MGRIGRDAVLYKAGIAHMENGYVPGKPIVCAIKPAKIDFRSPEPLVWVMQRCQPHPRCGEALAGVVDRSRSGAGSRRKGAVWDLRSCFREPQRRCGPLDAWHGPPHWRAAGGLVPW